MYHVAWEGKWVMGGRMEGWETQEGRGGPGGGKLRRGCRETQTGDQGLSVVSCSKYIDKLDGQTSWTWEGEAQDWGPGIICI